MRPIALNATVKTRSEEHTSELQSQSNLVCRLLLEKKKTAILYTRSILFFFNDTATTEIYPLSLHDALPIWIRNRWGTAENFKNVTLPPYSLQDAVAAGSGPGDPRRGAAAYETYCAQCHGKDEIGRAHV